MKPKVSVLIPSRHRPLAAAQAINSLGNNHWDLEVLLYVDLDDENLDEYMELRSRVVKIFTGTRYHYKELHKYYNFLSKQAEGKWLMLFNDDAMLETSDWIDKICKYDSKQPLVLNLYHPTDNLFPVISRKWYELLQHFSLNAHSDSWVQEVGAWSQAQKYVKGIKISHRMPIHFDSVDDDTYKEGRYDILETAPEFRSEEMIRLREKDAKKIKDWYDRNKILPSR